VSLIILPNFLKKTFQYQTLCRAQSDYCNKNFGQISIPWPECLCENGDPNGEPTPQKVKSAAAQQPQCLITFEQKDPKHTFLMHLNHSRQHRHQQQDHANNIL
jgi:hypothetical protein